MNSNAKKLIRFRIYIVLICFLLFFTALAIRAFQLQILKGEYLRTLAEKEYTGTIRLAKDRGIIYDRHKEILAISSYAYSIFADPTQITDPYSVARKLSTILELNSRKLLNNLKKKRSFVWVKRQVTDREAEEVKGLKIKGIHFLPDNRRYYPDVYLACHLLGFAGVDAQGLEGLELSYDRYLRAKTGYSNAMQDALGRRIYSQVDFGESEQGHDLILTIDKRIQHITEMSLKKVFQNTRAKGAMAIVMNPKTGEILAMANYPPFNPNTFSKYPPSLRRNRIITDTFEPGSTFKVFLIAGALEEGTIKPSDIFFCENGSYRIKGTSTIIKDGQEHDWLSASNIIKFSSNIGAVKIGQTLDSSCLFRYIKAFGFGEKTGIDLPGEVRGSINPSAKWSKVGKHYIAFGYGIATTPLQLLSVFSAIANDGVLMRPFVVKEIINNGGKTIKRSAPHVVRRVVSSKTARDVTSILEGVVEENGTGVMASLEGYRVAGKTGTARKAEPDAKGYSKDRYVASFMGFAPAEDPQIAVLVVVDEPKGVEYGGVVAAPVFKEITQKTMVCLNIPPRCVLVAQGKAAVLR